jgi:hypothetical protein
LAELYKNQKRYQIDRTFKDESTDVRIIEIRHQVQKLFLCEFYVDFCGTISKLEELDKNF